MNKNYDLWLGHKKYFNDRKKKSEDVILPILYYLKTKTYNVLENWREKRCPVQK